MVKNALLLIDEIRDSLKAPGDQALIDYLSARRNQVRRSSDRGNGAPRADDGNGLDPHRDGVPSLRVTFASDPSCLECRVHQRPTLGLDRSADHVVGVGRRRRGRTYLGAGDEPGFDHTPTGASSTRCMLRSTTSLSRTGWTASPS